MAKRRKIDWNKVTKDIKESEKKVTYTNDDGYSEHLFTPKLNDDGSFQAVVRFLPRPEGDGDGVPFVKLMNHGFEDVGGWFIENCPTTIGEKCPVCVANGREWKAGNQDTASARGRRTSFYANILVVKDPQTPENEGKVFIWRYGKKIQEKILEKIAPADDSIDEPVPVFDYDEGQNFKLKIKKIKTNIRGQDKTYNNYDSSNFTGTSTPVASSEKAIMAIDKSLHELGQIIEKDKFKSYEVLEKKFLDKTGQATAVVDTSVSTPASGGEEKPAAGFGASDTEDEDDKAFFENIRKE